MNYQSAYRETHAVSFKYVEMRKPDRFAIQSDEYHAKYVRQTADGTQFFLTTPFVPQLSGEAGRAFIALYFFEKDGCFREAPIDDLDLHARPAICPTDSREALGLNSVR